MKKYTKEQIEDSINWLKRDNLRLNEEINNFDKGKNPILENEYKKKIIANNKIIEELSNGN